MKKKVLQVTGALNVGGLEIVAKNYYKYIDKTKYDFVYLAWKKEKNDLEQEILDMGAKVIYIDSPQNDYIKFYKDIIRVLEEHGPFDIVHSHMLFTSGWFMKAAYKMGVPIRIAHSHNSQRAVKNSFFKKIYIKLMRFYLKKYANRIIGVNQIAGEALIGRSEFQRKGIVLENGIQLSEYKFNEDTRQKTRERLSVSKDDILLGNVARVTKVKNQEFILDITKVLAEVSSKYKVIIIGEGDLEEELKRKAHTLNIEKNILFLGLQTNISDYLQAMDIFLLPSLHEGAPLSLIEAQASKLPCITSDRVPDDTKLTENLMSLPINEGTEIWVDHILSLKLNNRDSRNISSLLESDYNIEISIQKLEKIYSRNKLELK
ncbi:glycosyltransferase [Aerococcus urinaeequi]|uniref:glycosyltransferase n=1 Tax=Aerococcus urinaeequi TaxID=51665 RepID=UPI003D6C48CA